MLFWYALWHFKNAELLDNQKKVGNSDKILQDRALLHSGNKIMLRTNLPLSTTSHRAYLPQYQCGEYTPLPP